MKRQLILMVWICVCAIGCMAVPAKPGPFRYTQPDGTVLTVTVRGDEFGHMIFSEEGLLLMENDGRLEYAAFGEDDIPYASGMAADGKGLPESVALTLQSPERIGAWAEKLSENSRRALERRNGIRKGLSSSLPSGTRSEEAPEPHDGIRIDFGLTQNLFPVKGEHNALVILVEYQDVGFKYGSHDYFDRMLNEVGFSDYGSSGSARDWLLENSGGEFNPHFDVYGPVTLPNERKYYGNTDRRAHKMALHAMQILDDEVDFSAYDCNGDGLIDNVYIIYAGISGLNSEFVWPHSACVSEYTSTEYYFDGVRLENYSCANEYPEGYDRPDGIGTFLHEFSHVLGLPDLYAKGTGIINCVDPYTWSILALGPYNNDGLTPPNYSSFEKACLGWIEFRTFDEEGTVELPEMAESGVAYAMPTENEGEYFFFENRQQVGNDEFLPGHGMLVWHVDYKEDLWLAGEINNDGMHQCVDIVEADNTYSIYSMDGDTFPGTAGVTEFGFRTKPQLVSWSGGQLEFDLTDISESEDGVISFKVVDSKNNTGDPGSVEDAISDRIDPSSHMYDVLGRRISKPAPGQIYIQGGKKKVRLAFDCETE